MIDILVALVAGLCFAAGLYWSAIVTTARGIINHADIGVSVMLDSTLSDDEKEAAVRKAGFALILGSWSVFWRIGACLAAAAAPIYLAEAAGLVSTTDVFALMLRLDYIIGVSVALMLVAWLLKRRSGAPRDAVVSGQSNSRADQYLHMIAFSGPGIQKLVIKLEDALFGRAVARVPEQAPILVTSLARGGTTAVLNALNDLPQTVTHTYRDMPFVTAPLLWGRLSAPLKRKVEKQKRAHGDGLSIDLDSPEAFDEIYWKLFWPNKYKNDHIDLWTLSDLMPEATGFFRSLFRKMALLRGVEGGRYLSKNNANIARLQMLPRLFEGAAIVIPIRQPAAHAASMLRQHENFLKLQTEDDFTLRYMRDIGHLEFGLLHTPIAFEGFNSRAYDPRSPDYWLAYWIAAFTEVRTHIEDCLILAQDDLRSAPVQTMQALCRRLDLETTDIDFANYFRPGPDVMDPDIFTPELLGQADRLYAELIKFSVR